MRKIKKLISICLFQLIPLAPSQKLEGIIGSFYSYPEHYTIFSSDYIKYWTPSHPSPPPQKKMTLRKKKLNIKNCGSCADFNTNPLKCLN